LLRALKAKGMSGHRGGLRPSGNQVATRVVLAAGDVARQESTD